MAQSKSRPAARPTTFPFGAKIRSDRQATLIVRSGLTLSRSRAYDKRTAFGSESDSDREGDGNGKALCTAEGGATRKEKVLEPAVDTQDPRFNVALARGTAVLRAFDVDDQFLGNTEIATRARACALRAGPDRNLTVFKGGLR